MKISIYAPYAKERFETAHQHSLLLPDSILHPERIAGNPETGHERVIRHAGWQNG
jgi:hypothetical protein